jgi:hypothetical protein
MEIDLNAIGAGGYTLVNCEVTNEQPSNCLAGAYVTVHVKKGSCTSVPPDCTDPPNWASQITWKDEYGTRRQIGMPGREHCTLSLLNTEAWCEDGECHYTAQYQGGQERLEECCT